MRSVTSRRGMLMGAAAFLLAPLAGKRRGCVNACEPPTRATAALDNLAESDERGDAPAVTSYTYDEHGRLLSVTTAPGPLERLASVA